MRPAVLQTGAASRGSLSPQHSRQRPFIIRITTILSLVVLQPLSTFAWGPEGHVYVNKASALSIPDTMPAFIKAAAERLGYLGPEPDRWREQTELALKQSQEPDHYIDLERVAWMGDLPPGRYDFYRLLYAHRAAALKDGDDFLPERVGLQPYITIEIYDRLKVAFREYRALQALGQPTYGVEQNIILYAGWLGHYVADGAQPMHTSVNYDGWVEANPHGYTTEHGIHAKFETDFVTRKIGLDSFLKLVGPPVRLKDPFRDYVAYLRNSHDLLETVYGIDKAGGFDGTGSTEALAFTTNRLAAASQMLLNLWYSAWVESGEPPAKGTP